MCEEDGKCKEFAYFPSKNFPPPSYPFGTNWMDAGGHVVVKHTTVNKTHQNDIAARGKNCVLEFQLL